MRITFLGTAAANAYPEAFCRCPNCQRARVLGGPSVRKRSAALINDDLLLDLGPDIMTAATLHGCPLTNVRYCLQTHAHADHLDPSHLLSRSPEYGVVDAPRLHFYASLATLQRAADLLARDVAPASLFDPAVGERLNLELHPVVAIQPFLVGPYRVIAFRANHDPSVEPLLYAVEADDRCIFYGTDTAVLPEETWQAFHHQRLRFDVVILDHTYGPSHSGDDHLSAQQVIAHAARMRAEGLLSEGARVLATHLAHDSTPPHPDLAAFAAQHGYEVAYDGLSV
jgi:phosphoribosyl 1,2-cyclic phosphate phosphodiesterase